MTNNNTYQVGWHLWCPGKGHHPFRVVLLNSRHIGEDCEAGGGPRDADVKSGSELWLVDAGEALSGPSSLKVAGGSPTFGVASSVEAPHTVVQDARIGDCKGEMARLQAVGEVDF